MKKKLLAMLCCMTLAAASLTGCGGGAAETGAEATGTDTAGADTQAPAASGGDVKVALITMDSIDQHWVTLNEGAQEAAADRKSVV